MLNSKNFFSKLKLLAKLESISKKFLETIDRINSEHI